MQTKSNGTAARAVHSIRVTDDLRAASKQRADKTGTTISRVPNELLEGYALGLIDLPEVKKIYTTPNALAAAQAKLAEGD